MSIDPESPSSPDHDLDDRRIVTDRRSVTAMFHPLRSAILDLLLERAASVNELAEALDRPPSSVAYHVGVLVDADLLRVIRTRRIRAVDERFYGRTARVFVVGSTEPGVDAHLAAPNPLAEAATEAEAAHRGDDLRCIHRHARVPGARAAEFWDRVLDLADEFSSSVRAGDATFALIAALYPTDGPALPPRDETDHR